MTQQLQFFPRPFVAACAYCHSTRRRVNEQRIELAQRYGCLEPSVCCTPDSEYRCPGCGSMELQFAMHAGRTSYQTGYNDSGEMAHCRDCGWTGDAEDAAPAAQPWAELAAVAERAELVRREPAVEVPELLEEVA